jgi:hypothetical protein
MPFGSEIPHLKKILPNSNKAFVFIFLQANSDSFTATNALCHNASFVRHTPRYNPIVRQ